MLFAEITDPNTGEPIAIIPNQILATRLRSIRSIASSTQPKFDTPDQVCQLKLCQPIHLLATDLHNQSMALQPIGCHGLTGAQAKATWFLGDFAWSV